MIFQGSFINNYQFFNRLFKVMFPYFKIIKIDEEDPFVNNYFLISLQSLKTCNFSRQTRFSLLICPSIVIINYQHVNIKIKISYNNRSFYYMYWNKCRNKQIGPGNGFEEITRLSHKYISRANWRIVNLATCYIRNGNGCEQ